jgi:Frag1/DRAM/Sfk1 family.
MRMNFHTYIFVSQFTALHENLFIVFMICSLLYMLVMLRVYRLAYPSMTSAQTYSFYTKLVLFVTSILATIGLVVFWFKHRRHCLDMGKSPEEEIDLFIKSTLSFCEG